MAILKPIPGSPSIFSAGTTQSSNIKEQVLLALMPSLSSFLPKDRPWVGLSTINALIPVCFFDLSVVANNTIPSASKAFVIHDFEPLSINLFPSDLAVVNAAPASEPLPGSLRAKHPTLSPFVNGWIYFSFYFWVANFLRDPR